MNPAILRFLQITRIFFTERSRASNRAGHGGDARIIVAAVLEREGRFLLVEEEVGGALLLNQPAGRLETGESAMAGASRETWEESDVSFRPEHLVGIYEWYSGREARRYIRLAYTGTILNAGAGKPNDPAIVRIHWLTPEQVAAAAARHRSPFVQACVDDYLRGQRFPLDAVRHFPTR